MTIEVIGAGFGRTGTMSLKMALEQLGYGPCHHMSEVFANPDQIPFWTAAANGETVDWHEGLKGYRSIVDWPGSHYWRQLAETFPAAKVILSVRPAERWWGSFSQTIMKALADPEDTDDPRVTDLRHMARKIIADQTFKSTLDDEQAALHAFETRINEVTAAIPPERLLIFEAKHGWDPLCAFLGKNTPEGDFPRSNSTEEFWDAAGKIKT